MFSFAFELLTIFNVFVAKQWPFSISSISLFKSRFGNLNNQFYINFYLHLVSWLRIYSHLVLELAFESYGNFGIHTSYCKLIHDWSLHQQRMYSALDISPSSL